MERGQSTRVKDKNGNIIYEYDKVVTDSGDIYLVMYDDFGVPCLVKEDLSDSIPFDDIGFAGKFKELTIKRGENE